MRTGFLLLAALAVAGLGALVVFRPGEPEAPPAWRASAGLMDRRPDPEAQEPAGRAAPPPAAVDPVPEGAATPPPAYDRTRLARRPPAEPAVELDEELAYTEEAIAASRHLSEAFEREALAPPPARPAASSGGTASARVVHACEAAGHTCLSSADCCAGLACAGGLAGYGTLGSCEAPR